MEENSFISMTALKKKKEEKGHNSKSKKAVMVIIMEMVTHGHDLFLSDGK